MSSVSTHAPTNQGANSNGNNQHQARAPQNQNQNSNQNKGYNNSNYQQHSGRGRGRGYMSETLQESLKDGPDFVTGEGTMFPLKKQIIC